MQEEHNQPNSKESWYQPSTRLTAQEEQGTNDPDCRKTEFCIWCYHNLWGASYSVFYTCKIQKVLNTITDDWLPIRRQIIRKLLEIVHFCYYNTGEGWCSNVWREKRNTQALFDNEGGTKTLQLSTKRQTFPTRFTRYHTHIHIYFLYFTLFPPATLWSSASNV